MLTTLVQEAMCIRSINSQAFIVNNRIQINPNDQSFKMTQNPMNLEDNEPNKPIVSALIQVLGLWGIEKSKEDIGILHQQSFKYDIDSLLGRYEKDIKENRKEFIVVYFDFLKNQETDKWGRDTYRFWCKFFKSLGVGYEGSDLIRSIGQIKDANRTNEDGWHFKLYDYIEKNKKSYFKDECDLSMMLAIDISEKQVLIAEFESNKKTCVALIVGVPINETKEWTIAGFNNEKEFKTVLINNADNKLAIELNKKNPDREKIIELATSYLGHTLKNEDKDKSTIELIESKDYSFTRVAHHGSEEKDEHKFKLSYLIAALKESALWGFEPGTSKFKILIIDDRLYDSKNEAEEKHKIRKHVVSILKLCEQLSIDCYGLVKSGSTKFPEFPDAFQTALKSLQDEKINLKPLLQGILRKENDYVFLDDRECAFLNDCNYNLSDFDYLLVDLWYKDTESMRGLGLISEIHHKFQEMVRKTPLTFGKDDVTNLQANVTKEKATKIPEILAYSISKDAETIQMAQRMGAAGYIYKGNPEALPLSIVRAGLPLKIKDATRLDYLSSNNFPCIASLPRQIIKHLFNSEIAFPNADGRVEKTDDLMWIRSIPKADNHVHFGTAIPLEWCYILSLISLYHWNNHWKNQIKDAGNKYEAEITKITERMCSIITNTLNPLEDDEVSIETVGFRRRFIHFFSKEYNTAEVVFLKDVINYLVKISDKLLTDNQIACLINVLVGCIKFDEIKWKVLYAEARDRIERLKKETKDHNTEIRNIKLFRDCGHSIENISLPEVDELKIPAVYAAINRCAKIFKSDFDPLSEMLSTGKADNPYGLERYLVSSCLVGSSLLQFADTVLLASMSIPEWAAAKKVKEIPEAEKVCKGKPQ